MLFLTISFACYIGVYFSLGNILSSLFYPLGFDSMQIACIGVTMLFSGFIGVSLTGVILDKTNAYKKLLIFLVMISFAFFGLLLH